MKRTRDALLAGLAALALAACSSTGPAPATGIHAYKEPTPSDPSGSSTSGANSPASSTSGSTGTHSR